VAVSSDGSQNVLIGVLTGVFVGLAVLGSIAVVVVGTAYLVFRNKYKRAQLQQRMSHLMSVNSDL
jgi:uncharacterized membrane protein